MPFASHWSATGLIISGVAMATIMSTPSSVISLPACDAAVSEFDCTSATMISTLYDFPPIMRPSLRSPLTALRVKSLASPNPARGPVSGAVKPILNVPSAPPPPNFAALPTAAAAAAASVVSTAAAAVVSPAAAVVSAAEVSAAPVVSLDLELLQAARTAETAAIPPSVRKCRRFSHNWRDARSSGVGFGRSVLSMVPPMK
jgi:hypothetical protein